MERKSLQYNLGFLIGEYIISQYLPVLDICHFSTNNVIKTTEEEKAESTRLDDIWYHKLEEDKRCKVTNLAKKEWIDVRKYNVYLTNKYLPKTLECCIPIVINLDNDLTKIKKGIRTSLWDSDVCEYNINLDKIRIEECKEAFFREDMIMVYLELDSKFDDNDNE